MVSSQTSIASWFKKATFQFCFCVGLFTVLGFVMNQFHRLTGDDAHLQSASSSHSTLIDEKYRALVSNSETPMVDGDNHESVQHTQYAAVPMLKPKLMVKELGSEEIKNELSSLEASASPSPSPNEGGAAATTSPSPAEAGMETVENGVATNEAPIIAQSVYVPNPGIPGQNYENNESNTINPAPVTNAPPIAQTDMIGTGVSPVASGHAYGSISSGSTASSASSVMSYQLNAQELAWISSAMKGVASDRSYNISGVTFGYPNRTLATASQYRVYQLRWGIDQGLSSDVGFAVKNGKSNSVFSFQMTLKLQDRNHNEDPQNLSLVPKAGGVSHHQEIRNGNTYQIYDFNFNDVVMNGGDALHHVKATLVYQMNGQVATLTNESALTFSRNKVSTLGIDWSFTNPNPPIQVNQEYFIADELQYQIMLEKS